MENKKKWERAELLLFTVIAILNILPYISTRFFPSMDGASHLANSNIINQLLFYKNEIFQQFFRINPEPVPNWTSHLLISILTLILPAFIAEKILLVFLLAGIPWAFRSLMKTISPDHVHYSYLVFPFTHPMFFFFGFFNFCAGILFFLIALNYWLRNQEYKWSVPRLFVLFLLVSATYFSHILVFGTLLIVIALHITTTAIMNGAFKKNKWAASIRTFLRSASAITISSIIPLVLFVYFFYSRPGTREIKYIPKSELIQYLYTIRPLISFNTVVEGRFTTVLFIFLCLLVLTGMIYFIVSLIRQSKSSPQPHANSLTASLPGFHFWWLLGTLAVLLILYFFLPDAYGTASYTNLRIAFVFFLVLILWISTFRIPWWFGLFSIIAGLTINTILNRIYQPTITDLGNLATSCYKASGKIKPNSLVLPIYCMDNWFTGHFVDYLAVDKPVVMVYNYECESGYFPVTWNLAERPNYYLGNPSDPSQYVNFEIIKGRPSLKLDYVFVLGHYDPAKDWFFSTLHAILTERFTIVYQTENCCLYADKE
jgi:hypothetical protein